MLYQAENIPWQILHELTTPIDSFKGHITGWNIKDNSLLETMLDQSLNVILSNLAERIRSTAYTEDPICLTGKICGLFNVLNKRQMLSWSIHVNQPNDNNGNK
jgi:hypothetical protein